MTNAPPIRGFKSVHPRVRGEHVSAFRAYAALTGSSPRSRGTCRDRPGAPGQSRFIPAFAGNIAEHGPNPARSSVHPRVRGEHMLSRTTDFYRAGSSPRSRGTLQGGFRHERPGRFIPAFAGNIARGRGPTLGTPVHPRVRGEHSHSGCSGVPRNGSSPRSRGTCIECPPIGAEVGSSPRSRGTYFS